MQTTLESWMSETSAFPEFNPKWATNCSSLLHPLEDRFFWLRATLKVGADWGIGRGIHQNDKCDTKIDCPCSISLGVFSYKDVKSDELMTMKVMMQYFCVKSSRICINSSSEFHALAPNSSPPRKGENKPLREFPSMSVTSSRLGRSLIPTVARLLLSCTTTRLIRRMTVAT